MGAKGRVNHTPYQRAKAALGVAERLHAAAEKRCKAAKAAFETAEAALTEATDLLAHAQSHPALREDPKLPLGEH